MGSRWCAGALENTYVGPDPEAKWSALFRTTDLFRRAAVEVAGALGFTYPQQVDDRVILYLNAIRQMPPPVKPPWDDAGR